MSVAARKNEKANPSPKLKGAAKELRSRNNGGTKNGASTLKTPIIVPKNSINRRQRKRKAEERANTMSKY